MNKYSYSFRYEFKDGEVFFCFPKFPDLISAITEKDFQSMDADSIERHAADAVITALQTRISCRGEVPLGENHNLVRADGFVSLSVQQAMKLELYLLFRENGQTLAEFSKHIGKKETVVRRMLNLRHPSLASEIEAAVEAFGKRLVHSWTIEIANPSRFSARSILSSKNLGRKELELT